MRPGDSQLVRAALGAVARAQRHPTYVHLPTVLDNVHVALNELLLREQRDFFAAFVAEGRELARAAEDVLGAAIEPAPDARGGLDDIVAVIALNARAVDALARRGGEAAVAMTRATVDWELRLYAKRVEEAGAKDAGETALAKLTAENFTAYLLRHKPEWPEARVTSFRLQPGGYSKITVLATVEDRTGASREVVIRAEPARRMLDLDGMAIASEYPIVRYAFEAGLPVAKPLLLETDTSYIGMQFMVSQRMPGATLGNFVGSTAPIDEPLVRTVLALIARIANTPVDQESPLIQATHLGRWIAAPSLPDNTTAFIEYWRDVGVRGNSTPSALLNFAVNWLLDNVPRDDARPNLIHGDVGFHNILFDQGQLSALLDWENARFGDTAEELSMFVSSISHLFDHADILRWYHEEGGPYVSEWRLRYFDVYMAMKIVVSAQVALERVEENPDDNLHLAVFGLRYLHPIGSRLASLIERAEAVKPAA